MTDAPEKKLYILLNNISGVHSTSSSYVNIEDLELLKNELA